MVGAPGREGAGGVDRPSLLSSDSKAGAGGGSLPRTSASKPGCCLRERARIYIPSQNISPKVKHLFGHIAVI